MRTFVESPGNPNGPPTFPRGKRSSATKPIAFAALAAVACLVVCVGASLAAASPTVSTRSATDISDTSAVLQATVVPDGLRTTYWFQYGPTSALGTQSLGASAGAATTSIAVQSAIAGLSPGITYYYRVDAKNSSGAATGAAKTFRTSGDAPPSATTGAVLDLTKDSVTMTGIVYPQSQTTTYYFKYGPTTAYGLQTAAQTVPAGTAAVSVTTPVPGLEPGLMFHYQLVAVHGTSTPASGADASFETLPSPAPKPLARSRTI